MMNYSTYTKKMGIVLLSIFLYLQPMDSPKKVKGKYSKVDGEYNIVIDFFKYGMPDKDNPFIVACEKNSDVEKIKLAISELPKKNKLKKTIVCQACYYVIKNDNNNVLEFLRNDKKTKAKVFSCLSKNIASFMQLAIFLGNWDVMESLIEVYAENKAVKELSPGNEEKQADIFQALSQGSPVIMRNDLFEIIKENHKDILQMFKDRPEDLEKYTQFIKQKNLFSPKQLQELYGLKDSYTEENDPCQPKNGSPRKEKCIIS